MTFTDPQSRLIDALSSEIQAENLAIFAGAGMSAASGFVDWANLLRPIADELLLDIDKETDLVSLAQHHCNSNGNNRGHLNQIIFDNFSRQALVSENHKILARLPIDTYWTTNYDKLIESALIEQGKIPDVKHNCKQLLISNRYRDAVVYKMHGDVDHSSDATLTKDDYERYHAEKPQFISALTGDLTTKTMLFVGFSFTDPNLDYILSRVRCTYNQNQRRHHCIIRTVKKKDTESTADFEYRKRKQELFVVDLRRFNILTTFIDDYQDITKILLELEWRHRKKTVFISGSAHEFTPHGPSEAALFIHNLSQDIISSGHKIVSGFGLGVGGPVITGALEKIYMTGKNLRDQLILRPFPQDQIGARPLADVWNDYRHDMIKRSGIALFLFGNKLKDGTTITANGVISEMKIAREHGLLLIPIGATGYAAMEITKQLLTENYYSRHTINNDDLLIINNPSSSLDNIRMATMRIIKNA